MSKQTDLINVTDAITVDSSNNVGIGTSSPTGGNSVLTIKNVNGTGAQINFRNAAATDGYIGLSGDANGDLIHYLGATADQIFYTSGSETMRIDSSGRVTMPYQPSAVCYFGNTNAYIQEPYSWVFDNTEYNTGGHYSTSTGRFTAPVAGVYQVSFFTLSSSSSDAYYLVVRKNGAEAGRAYQHYRAGQMHMQVKCNANDYLQVGTDGTSKSFYHGRHYTKASFHFLG